MLDKPCNYPYNRYVNNNDGHRMVLKGKQVRFLCGHAAVKNSRIHYVTDKSGRRMRCMISEPEELPHLANYTRLRTMAGVHTLKLN